MLYEKPVRELLRDGVESMPATFSKEDLTEWFALNYPRVNERTVYLHFLASVANNSRPFQSRIGDLAYKRSDGRYERYDPAKHGPSSKLPRPRPERGFPVPHSVEQEPRSTEISGHVSEALAEFFGSSFEPEFLQLRGGGKHEFNLASEDGEMVGIHVPLGRIQGSSGRFARLAEATWLLQGLTQTASRFVLITEERRVAQLWLEQYHALALGVEFFLLDGEHVVDLKEGIA